MSERLVGDSEMAAARLAVEAKLSLPVSRYSKQSPLGLSTGSLVTGQGASVGFLWKFSHPGKTPDCFFSFGEDATSQRLCRKTRLAGRRPQSRDYILQFRSSGKRDVWGSCNMTWDKQLKWMDSCNQHNRDHYCWSQDVAVSATVMTYNGEVGLFQSFKGQVAEVG